MSSISLLARVAAPLSVVSLLAVGCSSTFNPGGTDTGTTVVAPLPHTLLNDGSVGSSCGTCQEGLSCFTSAPSGICTKSCVASVECGNSAICSALTTGETLCFRTCTKDNECREGYTCQGAVGSTVCFPAAQ